MGWYPYTTLAAFLINIFLAVFVYSRSKGKKSLILFGNMLVMASIWQISAFFVNISKTPAEGLFWNRILHIGAIMVVPTFFHFAWDFAKNKKRKRAILVPFVYIVSAYLLLNLFSPSLIESVKKAEYIGYLYKTGPLYYIYGALFAFAAIYGVVVTYRTFQNSQGYKKQRAKFILFCLMLAVFAALVFFAMASNDTVKIPPVDNLISIVFSVTFTYAVLTYRIIDVRVLITKIFLLIAYSIFFLSIYTAVSSLLFWLLFREINYTPIITATIPFAVFIALFRPLRKGLLEDIDRIVYGGDYEYRQLIKETSEALVAILDFHELLGYLTDTLKQNLKPQKLSLFLKDGEEFTVKSSSSVTSSSQRISSKTEFIKTIETLKRPFMSWEFDKDKPDEKKVASTLKRLRAQVVSPLFLKEDLIGFLALDAKISGKSYSSKDLEVLNAIASTAAIALQNARLYEEAITDGLTGLYHHRYFQHRIKEELARSIRDNYPLTLLMLDIDYFKNINDKHGHQTGDRVLEKLADIFKENLRLFDIIARYGGEEFAILIPALGKNTSKNHFKKASTVAERLRQAVQSAKFTDKKLSVTVSIGVAFFNGKDASVTPSELIGEADQQLYKAKGAGRNRVCKKDISKKMLA